LVSLLSIIPLAGTLVRFVPPPRTPLLAGPEQRNVRGDPLGAQLKRFGALRLTEDFPAAATLAQQGYRDALRARDTQIAGKFLLGLANCRFALHQYREALPTYLEARKLAEASGDNVTAEKADFNISSLYSQLGQMDAATAAIGRAIARLSGANRLVELPKLLAYLAALETEQGRLPQAVDLYRQAIAAADRAGDREIYALAWNGLGYAYLKHAPDSEIPGLEFAQAEYPLLEAYRVRKLNHLRSIEGSYRNLGMLRLEQGDPPAAAALLDRAVALSGQPGGLRPVWDVYYARGRVRLAQNRLPDALDDLRIAAELARNWRRGALPDDATRVSAENMIQKVHSALVEAGNRLYFATGRRAFAQETFESAEANRSASLRALLAEPRDWRRNLPAEYWETLRRLESAEAESLRSPELRSGPARERIRQLQGALIEWESRAGTNPGVELPNLLDRTRHNLGPESAFLAFHLASPNSYLWAVSRERFALYRLPPGPEIGVLSARFANAVRQGSAGAPALGQKIFSTLFGQLDPAIRRKPRWLLALDTQLFELPLAALVEETGAQGPIFLAERHSLQISSGAAMLTPAKLPSGVSAGPFVGVADPIYNRADPRWQGSQPPPQAASSVGLMGMNGMLGFFTARAGDTGSGVGPHLARLPGSAREAADCATAWSGSRVPILLEGASASRQGVQAALHGQPAVLHFATHVIHSSAGSSGVIVLSLNHAGQPDILSPVEIATWNLDGALVALSGCGSGSAEALPATGLMGLTRACQAAGASAVVARRWQAPDDAGALFLAFYRYLRAAPQDGPAVALQHAQIAMLRSGTWRANPLYWGAFFVTGNQQ
jgi:CHAT domain-containing protein/tetratricopeptide (TPR) repeat protein